MKVIKRNGSEVEFSIDKIKIALTKANNAVIESNRINEEQIDTIANKVEIACEYLGRIPTVEDIQDMVERSLTNLGNYELSKKYMIYRYTRELARMSNTTDEKILSLLDLKNEVIKQENANKNPILASTQGDYMAGEVSKDLTRRLLLPKDIMEAHDAGIIHFHDSDYFARHIHNCDVWNLEDMLQNGTVISNVKIEKPHSFHTACNITTQIVAQIASSSYGGQTFSLAHLAPFVDVSRQNIKKMVENEIPGLDEDVKAHVVEMRLNDEIEKGIQTIQYQLITLMTTNGQTPFVSIFMYLDEVPEGQTRDDLAAIIKEVLKQRIKGVKNEQGVWITPAFPKLLYVLDEDNITEGSKYWNITKLAAECTAKRMVPDYISAKKMKELKKGEVYPCMGCVDGKEVITYRLLGKTYVESFEKAWSRLSGVYKVSKQKNEMDDYINCEDVEIFDTKEGFVKCYRFIRNTQNKWMQVTINGGRTIRVTDDHPFETENRGVVLARELEIGDVIFTNKGGNLLKSTGTKFNAEKAHSLGALLCTENYEFVGNTKGNKYIPSGIFDWDEASRLHFVSGMIDIDGRIDKGVILLGATNKELALGQMYLINSLGMDASVYKTGSTDNKHRPKYQVSFVPNSRLLSLLCGEYKEGFKVKKEEVNHQVESIENYVYEAYSYDVTTESEHFEVSGIYSHNCRSFLTVEDNFMLPNGHHKFYGRFNQGVVTINLPDVACASYGDFDKFWELLEERLELCHRALRLRHERLLGTPSDVAPILWQHGALARLKKGEPIDKLLYDGYSTISLGYSGLYETCVRMTGKSHTDPEAKPFALAVMQKLNDKCAEWRAAENIAYSVYGTPMESTTYKFAKAVQDRYGKIKDVSDHNYQTNSYHVVVRENIDAFSKLKFESEFQNLSPGGAISYVEVPNMQNNLPAVLSVMQYIYDNIMYAELNTKSDYCQVCGYEGEIDIVEDDGKLIWKCPNCGNTDHEKMNTARRVCGYIGVNDFNQGRLGDVKDRVLHL